MPANHPPDGRRGDARRPDARRDDANSPTSAQRKAQVLFWAGMTLAPVSVLVLLFGQSTGALRAAVALAVITIVLLAISMAIRPTVDMVRVDIEHRVLDEMERIRLRARDESASVAHQSHRALSDHIHVLNETIADLRAQIDEVQAISFFDQSGPAAIGAGPAPGPGIRRTETVHVTRRTTYDDTGTVYGSRSSYEHGGRAVDGEWREERWDDQGWGARPEPRALPTADGEPAAYYLDERDDRYGLRDRDRYDDRDHDRAHERDRHDDRGRSSDRGYERERGRYDDHDRHDDRGRYDDRDRYGDRDRYDDRDRDYERDRGYERDRYDDRDRGYEPDRYDGRGRPGERGYDRDRDHVGGGYDRDQGYERERGYDRERGGRGFERDRHDGRGQADDPYGDYDRGYDRHRPQVPRPRSSQW